ncbi:MAG: DUF1156 domain-containing protein [Candidatus Sumerlaeota bacterium]|nr:DUF1156 domain-containing protein [Candidatus Sumerlaeota bacterium]
MAPQCGTGIMPVMGDAQVQGEGHHGQDGHATGRRCRFDIVTKVKDHSEGTVTGGDALCPFPDCGRVIDGDEIKRQAQAGQMGQQLYCVVFKKLEMIGRTKAGKDKLKKIRGFRAPRPEDDVEDKVRAMLDEKMPEWIARNIVPTEAFPDGANDSRPLQYGMPLWRDMFAPRQLLGHGTSVEVFHELVEEAREKNGGEAPELDKAALVYLAIAIDKMIHYNAIMARWHAGREVLAPVFDRHDFSFKWSYGEMAPTITGLGYDWAVEQTGKALKELIGLCSSSRGTGILPAENHDIVDLMNASEHSSACCSTKGDHGRDAEVSKGDGDHGQDVHATILCGSADAMALQDGSVDAIVMDPPYYDNVMYAELADFFYVWLKRTAGLLYPERFYADLTDKDHEAVANPAKFKGQAGGAKNLAGYDYQSRMAAIFRECRRVLKPGGVMTVMFTHKASGAWDALATGLVLAGFTITASWPIQTEAEGSLHIKDKNAAKSTIFLVCRPKETERDDAEPRYWEEIEPQVTQRVREHVSEFQEAGISGVDLYLACFGPALQVFSENWPVTRGRPVPKPDWFGEDQFNKWDPYAAKPEDALDAARGEVKRWRMEQLATVKRQHHIDPLTEWFILAWDAFRAPKFPADEALKLARVAGLDFDAEVRNHVCEVKGSDVILWDSLTRRAKGKLGAPSETVMLDTLHQAAAAGRKGNTGAARKVIEDAGLLDDPTLLTALEALLNVLPPVGGTDFEALEKLRELAFREKVPESGQLAIFVPGTTEIRDDLDGVEQEEEDA